MGKVGRVGWRRDDSRHVETQRCLCCANVCSGFMVMWFSGDMKKMPQALCLGDVDSNLTCLEALEGEISNLVAWKIRQLLQAGFNKDNQAWGDVDEGNSMVNASRGASTWLFRFHSQTPSDNEL